MPTIKNLLAGLARTAGADRAARRDQLRHPLGGGHADRAAPVRQHRRPAARARSSRSSPETNRTGDVWHIFVEGLPNRTLYNIRADGPYNPAADGTRFNVTKTLLDPYAPADHRRFLLAVGRRRWATTTPIPTTADRHLRPSTVDNVDGCAALRRLPERLRLGGRPAPRHPDRGVDHLRGQRPRLHPPPLLGERPGGDLSRLHREDPLPEGAGRHGRRAAADHGVRPVRRPVPRPVDRRAAGQRLGLQHRRLLRPRVALQLFRQARRAGRRVQDARPRAAQAPTSRSSSTSSSTTPARGTTTARRSASRGWTTTSITCSRPSPSSTTTSPAAATR